MLEHTCVPTFLMRVHTGIMHKQNSELLFAIQWIPNGSSSPCKSSNKKIFHFLCACMSYIKYNMDKTKGCTCHDCVTILSPKFWIYCQYKCVFLTICSMSHCYPSRGSGWSSDLYARPQGNLFPFKVFSSSKGMSQMTICLT